MEDFDAIEILIVEDNPEDAELTIRALRKKNLANRFYVVEDGVEALDFIFCRGKFLNRNMNIPPKVIFLDLKLPKVSGLEVLKELRSHPQTKTLPVVMITSSGEDPDIKMAYDLGVNSYVIKPVNFEAFIQAMSQTGFYWLLVNQRPKI